MKRFWLVVAMVLFLASNVSAGILPDINYNEYGGDATAIAAPIANATALANQQQGQAQGQIQGQQQGQGQGQVAVGFVGVGTDVSTEVTVEKPLMAAPGIGIPETNFIVGETARYNLLPIIDGLATYKNELVTEILYYSDGNIFGRITPREVPAILIAKAGEFKDEANKRSDVVCRKASYTFNLGTGGAGAGSNASGYSASGIGIAGGGWAVADAYCSIWIYKVK